MNSDARHRPRANEEPEITQEESVPLDGKDELGEKQMKEVRNDKMEGGEKPKVPPGERHG